MTKQRLRPPESRSAAAIRLYLEADARAAGYMLDEQIATVRQGRPAHASRPMYDALALSVARLRARGARLEAIGEAIGKGAQTVANLAARGAPALNAQLEEAEAEKRHERQRREEEARQAHGREPRELPSCRRHANFQGECPACLRAAEIPEEWGPMGDRLEDKWAAEDNAREDRAHADDDTGEWERQSGLTLNTKELDEVVRNLIPRHDPINTGS
jgi:hypothetical protein